MAIINKMYLKDANDVETPYDIGASADNVAYDNNTSIKSKVDNVNSTLGTHTSSIVSGNGVHGIRYQDKLQVYNGGWIDVISPGGDGKVIDVIGAKAVSSGQNVTFTLSDPNDNQLKQTKLIRKIDSAPENESDGTAVKTITTKNEYSSTGWTDQNLTYGTVYYYRFFIGLDTNGSGSTDTLVSGTSIMVKLSVPIVYGDMFKSTYDPNNDGIIGIAQGGTGNSAGYIRTGQLSGSTIGSSSTIEGTSNEASGTNSHAEGYYTKASGSYAHAEGRGTSNNKTIADGLVSHAEGRSTTATGECSHAEGENTEVQSNALAGHAEGKGCIVSNQYGHAEGFQSIVSGDGGHTEGNKTSATNFNCHSEGDNSIASGDTAHAEGINTTAYGDCSHTEGYKTQAYNYSHAEGKETIASGQCAHAEGEKTKARGYNSHAGGSYTTAYGVNSFAHGKNVEALYDYSYVFGDGSSESRPLEPSQKYSLVIGHGSVSKMSDFGISSDFNSGFTIGLPTNGGVVTSSDSEFSGKTGSAGVIKNGVTHALSICDLGMYILFIDLISTESYSVISSGIYYVLGGRILRQTPGGQLPVKIVTLKTEGNSLPTITTQTQSTGYQSLLIDCTNVPYITQYSLIRVA